MGSSPAMSRFRQQNMFFLNDDTPNFDGHGYPNPRGRREGTSNVGFEVLKMNWGIDFIICSSSTI